MTAREEFIDIGESTCNERKRARTGFERILACD